MTGWLVAALLLSLTLAVGAALFVVVKVRRAAPQQPDPDRADALPPAAGVTPPADLMPHPPKPAVVPVGPAPATAAEPEAASIPYPPGAGPVPEPEPEPESVSRAESVGSPVPAEQPRTLAEGLSKTRAGFIARVKGLLFGRPKVDASVLADLEEVLYTADIGAATATRLLEMLDAHLSQTADPSPAALESFLKERLFEMVSLPGAGPVRLPERRPYVILVAGVNGVGKTTTIGKLAHHFRAEGRSVLLAAADTFRAAAVEQLSIWAGRVGAQLVKGDDGADPSSVVYNGIKAAEARGIDVVIADTAGRLHTKYNLMEELKKIERVAAKALEREPDEVLLVLDANTGQNAISQARSFAGAIAVSGIILSKLDGTAKGGVVAGICHELSIPVRYIGIGEALDDLRPFEPGPFVEALFS